MLLCVRKCDLWETSTDFVSDSFREAVWQKASQQKTRGYLLHLLVILMCGWSAYFNFRDIMDAAHLLQ